MRPPWGHCCPHNCHHPGPCGHHFLPGTLQVAWPHLPACTRAPAVLPQHTERVALSSTSHMSLCCLKALPSTNSLFHERQSQSVDAVARLRDPALSPQCPRLPLLCFQFQLFLHSSRLQGQLFPRGPPSWISSTFTQISPSWRCFLWPNYLNCNPSAHPGHFLYSLPALFAFLSVCVCVCPSVQCNRMSSPWKRGAVAASMGPRSERTQSQLSEEVNDL